MNGGSIANNAQTEEVIADWQRGNRTEVIYSSLQTERLNIFLDSVYPVTIK
jgi:hypothetical protein